MFADQEPEADPQSQTPIQGPILAPQDDEHNKNTGAVASDDNCAMRISLEGIHGIDSAGPNVSNSSCPISRRRSRDLSRSNADSVMDMMRMQLQIDSQRIQEQREDRAERRRLWKLEQKEKKEREEADRVERRERAEREETRHNELMSFMMLSSSKNTGNKSNEANGPSDK